MQLRNDPKWTQTLCNSPKHEFRVQRSGLGAFIAKNPDVTSRHPVFHRVPCSYETIPNAPKHYATGENMSLGPMEWIGCVLCENFRRDFVARTFALIAPADSIFHRVSCSYETIPNASQHYAMPQNMSLGSNGVDRVRSLRKILMRLRGTNLCINCTG